MSQFKFVDAPPAGKKGRNGLYAEFRQALRERPGEWAIAPREYASSQSAYAAAANIKRGRSAGFVPGEFEAVARDAVVYVRYVGGNRPEAVTE